MRIILFFLFISLAITVYTSLNRYLYKAVINNVPFIHQHLLIFRLIFILVALTPIIASILNRKEIVTGSFFFSFLGFNWLAFIFIFFAYHGIYSLIAKFTPLPLNGIVLLFFLLTSFSILVYGGYEAQQLTTTRVHVTTTKLPANIKQLKVLQYSDIHFGPTLGLDMAKMILENANLLKPDLIVFTGDMLDKNVLQRAQVIATMKKLSAPLGKYACLGNHEYIAGIKDGKKFIQQMGITLLEDQMVNINDTIYLAGANDLSAPRMGHPIKDELTYLKDKKDNLYTIFLKHQPRVNEKSVPYFDLQLSGHTHKGQIFPFYFIVKMVFPYVAGLYNITNDTLIYVNRGTGFWGPSTRFLAPPEATLFTISH